MNTVHAGIDVNLVLGRPGTHPWGVSDGAGLIEMMDRFGVEQGLITHIAGAIHDPDVGNRMLLDSLAGAPESRLHPVPVVRLRDIPKPATWTHWVDRGTRCVRLCPGFYREQKPAKADLDAFRNALDDADCFVEIGLVPFYGSSWSLADISHVATYAESLQDVPIVVSGISRGHYTDVESLLGNHPNIRVDVGNLTTGTGVRTLVEAGFENRLVWGSGFGISYPRQFFDVIATAGIPDTAFAKIVHDNAHKLIGGKAERPSDDE